MQPFGHHMRFTTPPSAAPREQTINSPIASPACPDPSLCPLRQSPIFTRQNIVENIATAWPHLIAVPLCVETKTSVNEACVPCPAPASVTQQETLSLRRYTKRQNEIKVDLRTQSKSFPPFGHLFRSCLKLESQDCPGSPECCLWGSESLLCRQR